MKTSLSAAGLQDLSQPPLQLFDVTAAPLIEENRRLRAALHQARRESAASSRALGALSHELRSPLSAIIGFSQLLDTGDPLTERQRRFVRHIEVGGRHLSALINEVLDLSKNAGGEMEVEVSEVEMITIEAAPSPALGCF